MKRWIGALLLGLLVGLLGTTSSAQSVTNAIVIRSLQALGLFGGGYADGYVPAWSTTQRAYLPVATLPVANGGSGIASYAVGDLLYASAATTLSKLAAVASGQILVSAGTTTAPTYSANLVLSGAGPHAIGGATDSSYLYTLRGTFAGQGGFYVRPTLTVPVAGNAEFIFLNDSATITEAASGTHPMFTGISLYAPTITAGVATLTNTAMIYVNAAMAGTVTGQNYQIWLDGTGLSRMDGDLAFNGTAATFHLGTPAVSDTSADSCGMTDPVLAGTNFAGKVTVGTVSGTSCTVTFSTAWTNAPSCAVTNETTANLSRATSTTTTAVLAGTFVGGDVLAYTCIGR